MAEQRTDATWLQTLDEVIQRPAAERAAFTVDGLTPGAVVEPADLQTLSATLQGAHKARAAVVPWGGGTQIALGNPPTRLDVVVSLRRLNRLIEYAPQDLTVTVEAGMTLAALNRLLAERRQFLPLDPPLPEQATVGGTLATDASGPLRTRYGTARDLVLGSRVVLADGTVVKAGGRVVKNVAGYDLTRLWIGSLGTLAVLAELTFKVYPLPEARQTVVAPFDEAKSAAAFAVHHAWNSSPALEALELLSPPAAQTVGHLPEGRWFVLTRFAGVEPAVRASVERLAKSRPDAETVADDAALWDAVRDLPARWQEKTPAGVTLRIGVLPTEVADVCGWLPEAVGGAARLAIAARPAAGLVWARIVDTPDPVTIRKVVDRVRAIGGHPVITAAPVALKRQMSVWGPPGDAFDLMRKMKQEFDPQGILSPGRFVGGI